MKILHIPLVEYKTLASLKLDFQQVTKQTNQILESNKKEAELKIKTLGKSNLRIFWCNVEVFKHQLFYILNETIWD